ncbi:MFS general substrate transporter [Cryphonectria parasitica EP155]|uniref:MFS general substrate transporter n=1 Tax=Cryphonectria parasitica (strain ATCC 38755 / EP155) TaxID=660469 RepID=A0A9P4Y7A3_CRYP1|nr:MFS general substrate transporter [Cryphonectria parasitica EP155]KAF3768043.1 MFS general substrate transporter [Cryphonectria parasitica EP155]
MPIEPLDLIVEEEHPKVRTRLRLYAILSALYSCTFQLALFIAALDQTIVAISIPTICADLHSASGYVWIGGAYLLANAATGPIWAKCSDIWGRKPVLLLAVLLFAAASMIAALSTTMAMLIVARALQGVASGGLMQLVTITISDLFSVRKRSLYLGFIGFVWALAGSSGPLIGGAFTQFRSWRWCFWINLPISGVTLVLLLLFLDVHNPRTKLGDGVRAVDWLGTLSILAVTLLLFVGLDFGGAIFPWNSPKVVCLLVFGTLMIGFFLFSEQRLARYPLMPLAVFRSWSNNAIFLVAFLHGMVILGYEYYLPLYLQSVKQASPLHSGLLILPLVVTQATFEIVAGVIIHRTGRYRETIWTGVTIMTIGSGLYITFGVDTSVAQILGLEIMGGLGPALLFQGPMVAIQTTVSQSDTAAATASLGFIRSLAMALSVVVGGVVFQNSMDAQQASLAAAGVSESVLEALSGSQAAANVDITQSIQDPSQRAAVLEAFASSMRNMFIMYTCLAALAMVASTMIKHRKLNTEHTETKTGIQQLTKVARRRRSEQ